MYGIAICRHVALKFPFMLKEIRVYYPNLNTHNKALYASK